MTRWLGILRDALVILAIAYVATIAFLAIATPR